MNKFTKETRAFYRGILYGQHRITDVVFEQAKRTVPGEGKFRLENVPWDKVASGECL